jgi:hypothetical protein
VDVAQPLRLPTTAESEVSGMHEGGMGFSLICSKALQVCMHLPACLHLLFYFLGVWVALE